MTLNNMNNSLIPHDSPFFSERTHADELRRNTVTTRHIAGDGRDYTLNDIPKHTSGNLMRGGDNCFHELRLGEVI